MYPGRASIAVFVSHPAYKITRRLALHWHAVGQSAKGGKINALAAPFNGCDLSHGSPSPHDAYSLAGSGSLDQLAEMRFGFGKIDSSHG